MHTLGTLVEDGRYKKALAESDIGALVGGFVRGLWDSGNPLEKGGQGSYEVLNRDSGMLAATFYTCSFMIVLCSSQGVRILHVNIPRSGCTDRHISPTFRVYLGGGYISTVHLCEIHRNETGSRKGHPGDDA